MRFLLVFLPVLGAPLLHAPVLALDLLPALKRPIDGGRNWFGDNKTWRGALFMVAGVVLAALALRAWPAYWHDLPRGIRDAGPLAFGALLGAGIVLGELPNSFLKRRLGVSPGTQRGGAAGLGLTLLDQGDLVLGAWALLLPIWTMAVWQAAVAFAVISAIHLVINVIGYASARDPPPYRGRARLRPLPLVAARQPAGLARRHRARGVRVAAAGGVSLRHDQHVLTQGRQVPAAERARVGHGLAVDGSADGVPTGWLERHRRHHRLVRRARPPAAPRRRGRMPARRA